MNRSQWLTGRIASTVLLAYLGLFVVLSLDVVARLWVARHGMESSFDAALVLSYQFAHAITTMLGLVTAARVLYRAETRAGRVFGLLVLFLTLWYTKAFGFVSFPGRFQSWLAVALYSRGFPRDLGLLLFAAPWWALWLALAALIRVSAIYPAPISGDAIASTGERDRRGLLRSVAFAGVDVGALWRRVAAAIARRGGFDGPVVWTAGLVLGFLAAQSGPDSWLRPVLWALFGCGVAVAITNLRAGLAAATPLARRRMLWMIQASLTAVVAFAITGVLSLSASRFASTASFAITAIAPLAVLAGVAIGAKNGHPPDPRAAVRNTASRGGTAVLCALAYAAIESLSASTGAPAFVNPTLGIVASVLTAILLWRRVRTSANRLTEPVLVRSGR